MALLDRIFRRSDDPKAALRPLWHAIVARARDAHWYLQGGVPDTLDGRFDMVALVTSLTLLRLEQAPDQAQNAVFLTEVFVDDMDGQMRQIGFGDMVVGKQIGRIMAALGGRLGAYRAAGDDGEALAAALVRNLWRGDAPRAEQLDHVVQAVLRLRAALAVMPAESLIGAATLPDPQAAA
jgi:cytochrome b pre-mRNA-processing protein 3